MIKYKLTCKSCNSSFDSWFASSKEYEKLKKLKHINCYYCNSSKIQKTLMAPSILNLKYEKQKKTNEKKYLIVKNKIKEYQKFIKKNFEYVGENFAYEARSIHYNKDKKAKNIYGNATAEQVEELKEEGIEGIETIPWVNEKEN